MAEIKNTFLKGKMNQDLDSRLLPNGEYREAINLMISRSEGSTVGEFENVLGNTVIREIDGNESVVIGHFIDETNNIAYFLWTDFDSPSGVRATNSNNCGITQISLNAPYTPVILVEGWFLNFNKSFPVTGINMVEDLLFWTDNNNQPRKINVQLAQNTGHYTNEDQISVAKYAPCEPVIVLDRYNTAINGTVSNSVIVNISGNTSNVKIGDIVSEFETVVVPTEITEKRFVVAINSSTQVTLNKAITATTSNLKIVFERPTMTNKAQEQNANGATSSITSVAGSGLTATYLFNTGFDQVLPEVGMIVTGPKTGSPSGAPASDNITITSVVANYAPAPASGDSDYPLAYNQITLKFSKDVSAAPYSWVATNSITIGVNQFYDGDWKGDDAFLEDKFVRFSYRFKFEDNEYSLMAPFSQPMFIPKQESAFGKGENYVEKDMDNAYKSTILTWFENSINNILVKVPMPQTSSALMQTKLLVTDVDVLYKESDALAVKVLDTVKLSNLTGTFDTISWSDPVHGVSSTSYLSYDYTSNKPYKTLPQGQTTRVYDKVPIKALAQELIGNRVVYGNYVDKHTPPKSIAYNASIQDKKYYFHDTVQYPYHNLKQNRTYQVGFVLSDRYGRQSDVILSSYDSVENLAGSTVYSPYRSSSLASTEPVIDWFGDALNITIDEAINSTASTATGEPGIYNEALRPLGWYSYKVVVKQQEQEYYNVYLPGFVNGAPVRNAEDVNAVAYMSLLSDNINKIPRDLKEVGPTDLEYSSSEVLYIRVNNPNMLTIGTNASLVPWNQQYYPNLKKQNILSIASVRDMEIAAIPFVANAPEGDYGQVGSLVTGSNTTPVSIGSIPWGQCGPDASLYNSDLNPFVGKISTSSNGLSNPVGSIVTQNSVNSPGSGTKILSMVPFLSVAETKPVYSLLEIFWETSLQGKIQTLNSLINAQDNNVIGTTVTSASFAESLGNANEITPFNFVTGSSGNINTQLTSAAILQVVDQTGADRTSENLFTLTYSGAGGIYKLNTSSYFTFLASSGASPSTDIYTFTFRTVYNPGTGAETRDTSTLTATLTNVVPTITSFSNPTNITTASTTINQFAGFNGTNSSNTTSNKTAQLIWDLNPAHANYFANSLLFSMSSTGLLSVTGTIVEGTTYNVGVRLRDSDGLTGFNQAVAAISFTVGVQHTPKAICEGRKGTVAAACGQSYATYFLASATTPTFSWPITVGGISFPTPTYNYNVRNNATGSGTYTTGALTQGVMTITPTITSTGGSGGGSVSAYYTIQYRANTGSAWSQAIDTGNNSIGAIQISASTGSPGTSTKTFSILGEYRVVTTDVAGEGCSDGSTVQLYVNFADATYPGNCTGPL